LLDVASGAEQDLRQIANLDYASPDGRILNNSGQAAFWAQFTDGTSGIFLSRPIPEPSSLMLALVLGISASSCASMRLVCQRSQNRTIDPN